MKLLKVYIFILMSIVLFISCGGNKQNFSMKIKLENNWKIANSQKVNQQPEFIASQNFNDENWYKCSIPSTVLNALVNNGLYKNLYFGINLKDIDRDQFQNAWYFRNDFEISEKQYNNNVALEFDGINYRANLWLNGQLIADTTEFIGAFRQFQYDINEYIKVGKNIILVEVYPARPGDFTIGFVDWNPYPPDNNLGIFRDVRLNITKDVDLQRVFVKSKLSDDLKLADLTIEADLKSFNETGKNLYLDVLINDKEKFSYEITNENLKDGKIVIDSKIEKLLKIRNPKLWWPNGLGKPNLHTISINVVDGKGNILDREYQTFGIRKVEDYLTKDGHRGYKINGHKILIKGGGWVDDLLLADTKEKIEAQIRYAKHMNLNTLRLEGFWGTDHTIYNLCDKYGILIIAGWSCQWEWQGYLGAPVDEFGGIKEPEDMDLAANSWRDQILWLRNHPSIFLWMGGSDMVPRPELEQKYLDILNEIDGSRCYVGAASERVSELSGPTAMKMRGPYAFTAPNYWYLDKDNGGAFGFNTETGPGAQVPPIESILKMIPEDKLWPPNEVWDYHCGRGAFGGLKRFVEGMEKRYGKFDNVEDFATVSQVMNYELMRPMFEAFVANRNESTGIIQWMFNSAWPEMYWQLFDSYLNPNGAFYGAQKACQPVHILYQYGTKDIVVANSTLNSIKNYRAEIRLYDYNSKLLSEKSILVDVMANTQKMICDEYYDLSKLNDVYFLSLKLFNADNDEIDHNFYWLPQKEDVLDFENNKWFMTPIKHFADLSKVRELPKVNVTLSQKQIDNHSIEVILKNNTNKIAFFIEMRLIDNDIEDLVLPIFWSDNYVSLLPGESKKFMVKYDTIINNPWVKIRGMNL